MTGPISQLTLLETDTDVSEYACLIYISLNAVCNLSLCLLSVSLSLSDTVRVSWGVVESCGNILVFPRNPSTSIQSELV